LCKSKKCWHAKVERTRSYISKFDVHWRTKGKQSCGVALCGSTQNIDGCKGKKCHWSGSTSIHRNVGGNTTNHKWRTPKLLERFKCESEGENSGRKGSWDTLLNLQHFEGKRGMLELWDGE
jgi:hypothetical protein